MRRSSAARLGSVAALSLGSLVLGTSAALAYDVLLELPAGVACDFPLDVEITGGAQVNREFVDREGNVVRVLSAGRGSELVFINAVTGERLELRPNGTVSQVYPESDGSSTVRVTGHNVLILFPTDVPAGPSTTLYVGQVTYTVDPTEVFTLLETRGTSTDICAQLA